jgi:hypothetical protein
VLAVADQVVQAPSLVESSTVSLEESGTIRIVKGTPTDELVCEQHLRSLLDELMRVARGGGGALFRAALRESVGDLPRFVRELEAALIPANRAAARRSLARLHRETLRAVEAGSTEIPMPEPVAKVAVEARGTVEGTGGAPPAPQAAPPAPAPQSRCAPSAPEPSAAAPVPAADAPAPPVQAPAPPGASAAPTAPAATTEELLEIDVHVSPEPPPAGPPRANPMPGRPPPVASTPMGSEASPPASEAFCGEETPLEPVMQRVKQRESLLPAADDGRTPYLGTRVAVLTPPPLRVPQQTQGVWGDDGATDPMPAAECIADEVEPDDEALTPYLDRSLVVASTDTPQDSLDAAEDPSEPLASELPPGVTRVAPKPPVEDVSPAPPRYSRKSDVSELLQSFSVADPDPSGTLLKDLKSLAGLEPSATPPPVAVEPVQDDANAGDRTETTRSIRPMATVTVLGAVLCVAALAGPRVVSAETGLVAAATTPAAKPGKAPAPCRASVEVVGAPSNARIEVRPQRPGVVAPQWATGPEARFSELPCSTALEVLVGPAGARDRKWTRVPISAAELSPTTPKGGDVKFEVDVTRRDLY